MGSGEGRKVGSGEGRDQTFLMGRHSEGGTPTKGPLLFESPYFFTFCSIRFWSFELAMTERHPFLKHPSIKSKRKNKRQPAIDIWISVRGHHVRNPMVPRWSAGSRYAASGSPFIVTMIYGQ